MVSNSLVTLRARKLVMQVFAEKEREKASDAILLR